MVEQKEAWVLELQIPSRKPWTFTKHWANKEFTDLVENLMQGGPEIRKKKTQKRPSKRAKPMDEEAEGDISELPRRKAARVAATTAPNTTDSLPENDDPAPLYDVEAIVDSRFRNKKKGLEYRVHWVGWSDEDDTWEPLSHVKHCEENLADFHARHPEKPAPGNIVKGRKGRREG